ncbi:carbonic anhydrase [Bacillus thuringiensis]|uniref:carbonic anhydrase n=1 Tax=Bacillus thuringiensis TaxID=1428 RepID=UPI0018CD368E|nr:carbonic anhydrase family protein [Bacillus thuringiensis]MBG9509302.1 carbonic anhydrase [Bacillus thuringiensis]
MKKIILIIGGIICNILFTGCINQNTDKQQTKQSDKDTKQYVATDTLNYKDQKHWKFESGDAQSPINIDTEKIIPMKDTGIIELNYNQKVQNEEDNGHTIQVNTGGTATINGRQFDFTQFHFHAPSEHTINGKHYPLEAHFVHKSQDGRLAVIGVFFTEGKDNKGFQEILDHRQAGENNKKVEHIEISSIIPNNKSYYHYLGSLTTPPLSENVEWYVLKETVEASKSQIESFQKIYSSNNRQVQPLHHRVILSHEDTDSSQK